jgi:hypothetical protein
MGTNIMTPPIVTNGLVLHLDAANIRSYPGSGTTWTDLSGNNNHATATSPQYSGSYGGSFNFPNNTTSVFTTPSYTLVPNGGVTMEAFIYPTYNTFYLNPGNGSGITGRRNAYIYGMDIGPNVTPGGNPFTGIEISGVSSGTSAALPYAITNTWYHILWTYSTTSVKSYVNGVNQTSTSGTYSPSTDTTGFQIGKRWGGFGYPLYGNIAIVRWYNRPLSELEVTQNYNAQKSRFNLI